MEKGMKIHATWIGAMVLLVASDAGAGDAERVAMSRLRLTTEVAVTRGCILLGSVKDDSLKDLRRKIVREGGDTGLLSFGGDSLSTVHAQVFRCAQATRVPLDIPPPPPGTPPPPPPAPSR
jgi:hypothetical protein